jgi:hypothetical protein
MNRNEKQLSNEIKRLIQQVELLIYNNCLASLSLFGVKKSLSDDKPFWFSRNAAADKQMNSLLADFNKETKALFLNSLERSWKFGEKNYSDELQQKGYDRISTQAIQQQRTEGSRAAAERFADMKRNGLNLSDRIWKLGNGTKQEIETIIQNGMKEGKSADELAKQLKQYLNEPDKLFRKVRNKETGELELSEAAKKYKPGRGVYRSAYKNAMRLARTEITAAYRRAQWEKFQTDPQVIGIRIQLSNNHTCINPKTGKPEPFFDICDELAGDYPKTFMWTGWHPQCRCVMTPILVDASDFRKMVDAEIEGKKYVPKQITKMPGNFKKWINDNKGRISQAENKGTLPYWITENKIKISDNMTIDDRIKQLSNPYKAMSITDRVREYISICKELSSEMISISDIIAKKAKVIVTDINYKSEERAIEKVILEYLGDVFKLKDAIRNTFIAKENKINDIIRLIKENFDIDRIKYQSTDMGYNGYMINIKLHKYISAEIQINTPQMIYAKSINAKSLIGTDLFNKIKSQSGLDSGLGHTYYEEYRLLAILENPSNIQMQRMKELLNLSNEYYQKIRNVKL